MGATFKVPLTGAMNSRISQTAASSVWGIATWGVSTWGGSIGAESKDERYVNCFLTKMGAKNYVMKRPGFAVLNTPSAGNIGNQILIWTGQGTGQKVISSFGATNSTIYDGTTSLGAITGVCTGITETFVGTEATLCFTSSDNTGWTTSSTGVTGAVTFTGDTHTNTTIDNVSSIAGLVVGQLLTGTNIAALTRIVSIAATSIVVSVATTGTTAGVTITRTVLGKIIDVDWPGASLTLAGTFAHMDGYASVMTTNGVLWTSDLNTVTSWNALSFISTNAYPDKGVGCFRYKNLIMGFGTESTEFFYNSGNATGSPFSRVTPAAMKLGAVAATAIGQISDSIFFAGATSQGGIAIFQYDGSITRVSNPEQDFQLIFSGSSGISLTTLRTFGRSFVIVKTTGSTYVYVPEDKHWHEWTATTPLWYKCAGLSMGSSLLTYAVSDISTSGKVYTINPASMVFTDDSVAWTATIQTMKDDSGTGLRKFYEELRIICDREPVSSNITVETSDDDFQSFQVQGQIDISSAYPKMNKLGSSKARVWRLTHSANTPFRIERLEGRLSVAQW